MIRNVRIALFTVLLAIICCGTVNAYSKNSAEIIASPSTGEFYVGPWEGETRFSTGWSEWSTAVPNATKYAKATIYVSAIDWEYPIHTVEDWKRPAHKTVCEPNEQNCKVVNQYKTEYNVCTRWDTHYSCNRTSGHGSCGGNECGSCSIDYNNPTGTCTGYYNGSFMWCAQAVKCGGGNKPCYWLWNGEETSYTECGASENRYYWSETYTFADPGNKSNWRKSLSEAGGFAKQVYVYSYPQRVYINYDSMGADGLCTSWNKSSNNNYNANENILYREGNPVCNSKTTGYMSQSYVNYYQNDTSDSERKYNLSENQYMKTGYDFKGWVLDRSCLNSDGTLANSSCERYIFDDQKTIINTPGDPPNGLKANAGDTVTLYAVWQKHDYEITFQYWCGQNPNTKTYQYQAGLTLQDIKVNEAGTGACNTIEKSDTNGRGAITYFDGWYENYDSNGTYSSKISAIPGNYWKDITLYGRMHQIRTFDYSQNKWIWQ